MIEQEEITKL